MQTNSALAGCHRDQRVYLYVEVVKIRRNENAKEKETKNKSKDLRNTFEPMCKEDTEVHHDASHQKVKLDVICKKAYNGHNCQLLHPSSLSRAQAASLR